MPITAVATNTVRGQLPDFELRHRRRARCEDRIRLAKDTGLANLPLHSFAANRSRCCPPPSRAVVALAAELTAWMQLLAFPAAGNPRSCATGSSPSARPWSAPGAAPGRT